VSPSDDAVPRERIEAAAAPSAATGPRAPAGGGNQRARDAAESSRDRFAFLAEVSRCLADSLDYETTLATVAGLSLPYLGAWCIVDVRGPDGALRRLTVQHPDAAKQFAARTLQERYPPTADDYLGVTRVIESGRPELVFDVSDAELASRARDPDHLALLRTLGVKAYIIAPMLARGRVLGAITFVAAETGRRFGDLDVVIAEDLAQRAAMAVDNAQAHGELSRARAAAEAASTRTSEFLTVMSHELRTPLNAILGYTQLLEMGVLGPATPDQYRHLARLEASARHLLGLVEDVLDLAKMDAATLNVRGDHLITGSAVAAALAVVQPQATAKGVRLLDLGADSPGVAYIGDEARVRQIVINLLANAVKFTPAGGQVTVTCGRASRAEPDAAVGRPDRGARWAYVRVADTGPGIAPELAEHVFEPFVQGDSALTREQGGAGLGLAISRALARRMGGDLTLESKTKDAAGSSGGAVFILWLPAAAAADEEMAAAILDPSASARPTTNAAIPARAATAAQPALSDAAYAVLFALGVRLAASSETIAERYVAALQADGGFPGAHTLPLVQLRDHVTPFVGLLAAQLMVIGETRGRAPELLGDGGQVQRLMAELHGAQRWRLGWSADDLERETPLLLAEMERALRGAVDTHAAREVASIAGADAQGLDAAADSHSANTIEAADSAARYALDVTRHVLEQAARTAARAFDVARMADRNA
jgi:signal transduction histidine kinase